MPFQEVVEAEGHLIDSHIMENIFDKVVEYSGRFEVEQFRIGRTNSEASYLRLKVEAPDEQAMERLLQELLGLGCSPARYGRRRAPRGGTRPVRAGRFLFHTNHRTSCATARSGSKRRTSGWMPWWWSATAARCAGVLRDLRQGDRIVVGLRGIRVIPESKERDRLAFAFMANGISSERQVETAVRQTVALVRQTLEQKQKVVVVAGPVVVHTGGVAGLSALIRKGCVQALLSGNALACMTWRRPCSALPSACASLTAARRSTATAITCAPSTPSIARARCGRP